ncbi:hypothetical protein ADU37_CDS22710 [Thermococcus sp. 2319x1]|uniref:hypothetical protein n=1 Tax=Thermococcus sp. 2319x1 TaxID=1674923 RepID=UPI00073A7984|nr:hypothetical protein [Thermococcus sp. 2319x1]ALV63968.1 hypothetical protein ADU37_CDS22710 [Thermococcus sp. 2319x1]
MNIEKLLDSVPDNGVLSIIERDYESDGDLFGLLLVKHLLEHEKTVFAIVYDPLLVFKENLEEIGINFDDVVGRSLFIFDVFGSIHKIERNFEGIYQIKGYIDDMVFTEKFRELLTRTLLHKKPREVWFFTYLSSSVCKLFSDPIIVYKRMLLTKCHFKQFIETLKIISVYNSCECRGIEGIAYPWSDIVLETVFREGKEVGIITKGLEEISFKLFGVSNNVFLGI